MVPFVGIAVSLAISLAGASIVGGARWLKSIKSELVGARADISVLRDNHFQHLQASSDKTVAHLEKQTDILHSIDKNIAVLAARKK